MKFRLTHKRIVYIAMNVVVILLQVCYVLIFAVFAGDFGFSLETAVLVIFSKLVAIALGTGHLAYLVPLGTPKYRDCVTCLKFGFTEEII